MGVLHQVAPQMGEKHVNNACLLSSSHKLKQMMRLLGNLVVFALAP